MSFVKAAIARQTDLPAKKDPILNKKSFEFGFRSKRFQAIRKVIEQIIHERGSCEILDLGGTEIYWSIGEELLRRQSSKIKITLVNLELEPVRQNSVFSALVGDATDLSLFAGRSFDFVHSNSVIEHVGDFADMQRFADNVRRLAPRYYVQTPNYWFPYEPHFRFPGFQYLPERVRVEMVRRFSLGFFHKIPDRDEARDVIEHHRLISRRQLAMLFPDAAISFEKIAGLNKSIMAMRA